MDEIRKIVAAVVITAIIGGFSSYVQLAELKTDISYIKLQQQQLNLMLEMVQQSRIDLKVQGLWMDSTNLIITELRVMSKENRDRIVQSEFKIKSIETKGGI